MAAALASVPACAPEEPASTPERLFPDTWLYSSEVRPVIADHGMVVSTDPYASGVGLEILRQGGNAVDAAIAVQFALAVVNPEAGNIGGGGFMMVRLASGEVAALDFRETAPRAATRDMYLDANGNLTDRSVLGHLAAGVPGTVAGMWAAHGRFGSLPWDRVVDPAVELARGLVLHERLGRQLADQQASLRHFETTAAQFLPGGVPPVVGDTFRQPDLARTLERIRDEGPGGFYAGETAELIVAEMERGGGLISRRDLLEYRATWREPVRFGYRGHTVLSMPPSSSGGVTLAGMANILEGWDLEALGWHGTDWVHRFAEAARRAYADRNHLLGDPDFVRMPIPELVSDAYAAERRATIDQNRATPSTEVAAGLDVPEEGENTTHFSVVDEQGNAVAVTTTINSWFGSKVTVGGAGFLLNNEMDDFAAKPGSPNQFGLVQGEQNAIAPGKRMLSAMTPTIVLDPSGELYMVVGTPGGATIITTVFQVIANVIDHGMNAAQAVVAPRVHHQHLPDQITFEVGGLEPAVVDSLKARGHTMIERSAGRADDYFAGGVSGDVQLILRLADGRLAGASDPRRHGEASGY